MDGILKLFRSISNSNYSDLEIFLKALGHHQSFCYNESNTHIIQNITNLLSQASTRHAGLLILSEFLKQAPFNIIEEKGVVWTTLCIKACNPKEQLLSASLAYNVLGRLVQKSIDIPDLMKSFSNNLLSKIFETIKNINENCYLPALKLIKKCLKLYSGPCSQFRSVTEKFIHSMIDNKDENIVKLSGQCLHLLQQIRGTGTHAISYKTAWQTYQLQLLGSLHELLNTIYKHCSETYDENIEEERLKLNSLKLSNEPISRASQLYTRFKNILSYLGIAIKDPFSVSKCIMPRKILNLVSRVLAINCRILEKNPITDNLAIGALLPEIHMECFKLINTLILVLGSNLAMYHTIILNLIADTLKWTSYGKSLGYSKPYSSLRIAVYETLSIWCETMKHSTECQLIEETLIEQIIFDITPFQCEVTLKVLSGTKKHMSKKARRLLHKAQNEQTHLVQAHSKSVDPQNTKKQFSDKGNKNLCAAALNCLNWVLVSSSHNMKPTIIKEIQDKTLELCVQLNNENYKNEKLLYSSNECRRNLYTVVFSFVTSSNYLCPPPVQLILKILNHALIYDNCNLVRADCNSYIRNLETIIHPHKDNLNFPHDFYEIKKSLKDYYKNISVDDDDENEDSVRDENHSQVACEKRNNDNAVRTEKDPKSSKFGANDNDYNSDESEELENNSNKKIDSKKQEKIYENEKSKDNETLSVNENMDEDDGDNYETINISDDEISIIDEPITKKARLNEGLIIDSPLEIIEALESEKDKIPESLDKNEEDLVNEIVKTFNNEFNEERELFLK